MIDRRAGSWINLSIFGIDPVSVFPAGFLAIHNLLIRQRIIFISSDSHQGSSYIDYDEFGIYQQYGVSKGISNYSYFKLILNTYAVELSRRINQDAVNVGIHVICPGPVHSEIIKEAPGVIYFALKNIFRLVFRSPAKAAKPVLYMSVSSDYEEKSFLKKSEHTMKSRKEKNFGIGHLNFGNRLTRKPV